jgi:DNA-binding response OmpR family regulator
MNAAKTEPKTILAIDDDPEMCNVVKRLLTSAGHRVITLKDPRQAVAASIEARPDLILCDITMPDMDGYDVVRALQTDPRTSSYPVVFLTGARGFLERVRAFRFGVVDYICKPFTRDMLIRKIERVLENLAQRTGTSHSEEPVALLARVQREARTGVFDMSGPSGQVEVLIHVGQVVGGNAPHVNEPGTQATFRELDPASEQIVSHDPPALPGDLNNIPDFGALPEIFRSVLIADDNALFRSFLGRLLRQHGFRVIEAADGEEALRLAFDHKPWLILTDLCMPHMSGYELCRHVRNHSLISHARLIFLSGWDDYKNRHDGYEAGADEFLPKDTSVRELLIRIHLIMSRFASLGGPSRQGMHGAVDLIGMTGLLQTCHLTRLTGVLSVTSGQRAARVQLRNGEVVSAQCGDANGAQAIYDLLGWVRGYFEFVPSEAIEGEPLAESFNLLLLEGCRRLDDEQHARQITAS